MDILKPGALQPGDTIAIISPSSRPPNSHLIWQAQKLLEQTGFRVTIGRHALDRYGALAGKDHDRLSDFHSAWVDPQVKAIVVSFGGDGALRLLNNIDYALVRNNPKVFIGYGDVTALHLALARRTGLVTFHGPSVERFSATPFTFRNFIQAISSQLPIGEIADPLLEDSFLPSQPPYRTIISEGTAQGRLIGGNLGLICHTLGTPYEIDTTDKILFLEEVDEEPYRIDSMFNQLALAGKLKAASGIVVGALVGCEPRGIFPANFCVEELIEQYMSHLNIPVIYGLYIGHTADTCVLPLGVNANLQANSREARLVIEEAACK